MELHKNEEIHILVGQMGINACIKSLNNPDNGCSTKTSAFDTTAIMRKDAIGEIHMNRENFIKFGAGGGGGASFIFLVRII
jgi:hypothetical protein